MNASLERVTQCVVLFLSLSLLCLVGAVITATDASAKVSMRAYNEDVAYINMLAVEAPETLYPPRIDQFASEYQYRAALVKYAMRGNWATE